MKNNCNENFDRTISSSKLQISKAEFADIVSDEINLFIVQKLRHAIWKISSLKKLMKIKFNIFKSNEKEFYNKIKMLFNKKIIYIVGNFKQFNNLTKDLENLQFEQINSLLNNINLEINNIFNKEDLKIIDELYLVLVKDFIAIKRPPTKFLDLLENREVLLNIILEYKNKIKEFFSKYQKDKNLGDDQNVISLFKDLNKIRLLELFYKCIIIEKDSKELFGKEELLNILKKDGFLTQIENYLLLLLEPQFEIIFPQYIINKITEQVKQNYISKEIAIICLEILKKEYIDIYNEILDLSKFKEFI